MYGTKGSWLLILWVLVLLVGAVINHFRRKKLDFSLGFLWLGIVLCVLDFFRIFNPNFVAPNDRPGVLGSWFGCYLVVLLPAALVSWRFRRKRARELLEGPTVYRLAGYRDLEALNKWVIGFLYAQVVITLVSSGVDIFSFQFYQSYDPDSYLSHEVLMAQAVQIDQYQAGAASYSSLIFLISAVLLLRWVYRVSFNAWQFAGRPLRYTPGWSVGCFFVPVVHLWKPWQAMREIWQVSHGQAVDRTSLLRWWWGLLLTCMGLAVVIRLSLLAGPFDFTQLKVMVIVDIVSNTLFACLALVTLKLVKRIHAAQRVRANELPVESPSDALTAVPADPAATLMFNGEPAR